MEEKHFSLEKLACHLDVDISKNMANKKGDSNKAAAKIVGSILSKVYKMEEENGFILNGKNASEMITVERKEEIW